MKKSSLIFLYLLLCNLAFAQNLDSLNFVLSADTILQNSINKADSITAVFQFKADSLNTLFQKQFSRIDSSRRFFQGKIDSLGNLRLPTEEFTKKLDSLNQVVNEKINTLNKRVEDLKSKTTKGLKEIQLPPELQEPMKKLQSSIEGYALPTLSSSNGFPSIKMPDIGKTQLASLSKQLNIDTDIGNISDKLGNIKELTDKAGEYSKDAKNLVNGNLNEVKNIDKTIENKVAGLEGLDQLKAGSALLKTNSIDSAALAEKGKVIVKEQLLKAAKDHFAGKEELLQQAMANLDKFKKKYSEVKDVADLPKRLPNPLKGKPLIERLVPALSFQIQKSDYFLLDVNPMLMYRISPHFSAGAGWNHRLPFDGMTIKTEESIYGPRAALEFKWTKGINFRLLPEIMNTTIPTLIAQSKGVDPAYREWIGSLFFGIKKDFKIYKQIKGNSEILYNLYDANGMSPYGDKLAVRFGFEFPMKKSSSSKTNHAKEKSLKD